MSSATLAGAVGGLAVQDLVAGYGGGEVLRGVSLSAPPGMVTGLIGPNGSGKTTVVRVASRVLPPAAGRVLVQGVDVHAVPAREAARLVAVVPQDLAPAFAYSVLEMVMMGRAPHRSPWGGASSDDWAASRRAMRETTVQHLADRSMDELSGGERERVILAQALAQDAPVLLLDEPTTHLDPRHVAHLLALVRRLARVESKSVLAIFHDLNLAAAYCDRVYALFDGEVVAEGSPGQVITRDVILQVFGVEADIGQSAATGRPTVFVPPPVDWDAAGSGAPRVHVIGGAGRGADIMRGLAEMGYEVTVGVLHATDTDEAVAERLNLLRVTVPPFSEIDPRSAGDCLELMRGAALLVVCDAPFGPGNVGNLQLALDALAAGVPCLMLDGVPIQERDFTGGEATRIWGVLREQGRVAGSNEELMAMARGLRPSE